MQPTSEITELLIDWSNGDKEALDRLFPLIEKELHRLAHYFVRNAHPDNTLQTTALINETYIKLVDQNRVQWQNRAHFFAISARIMRRILLQYARRGRRQKRGGGARKVLLTEAALVLAKRSDDLILLDDALKNFEKLHERKSRVVEMRYFGGLSVEETAAVLKVSEITVMRDWKFAKAWLARQIGNAK